MVIFGPSVFYNFWLIQPWHMVKNLNVRFSIYSTVWPTWQVRFKPGFEVGYFGSLLAKVWLLLCHFSGSTDKKLPWLRTTIKFFRQIKIYRFFCCKSSLITTFYLNFPEYLLCPVNCESKWTFQVFVFSLKNCDFVARRVVK